MSWFAGVNMIDRERKSNRWNRAQVEGCFGLFCASCLFRIALSLRMLKSVKVLADGIG
jgi:hypothetical protein